MKILSHIIEYFKTSLFGIFFLGCLIGSIIFIGIYGISILDVTNDTWLLDSSKTEQLWDLTQHYLGWIFYRNSEWHFPLGLVDGLYSESVSIAYTDSIPLFAFIFKLLSPILPETFQYFGIFGLICYALMGGFGALITRKFTDSIWVNLCSSSLFVMAPCLLKRMFYHTALSAHFLILAAFCLWLYRDSAFKKRSTYLILWSITAAAATLINPYLTPMVLGILFCSLLQEWIANGKFYSIIPGLIFPCISVVLSGYIIGIFYGNVSPSSEGLENLSFNLLQFFNPTNYLLSIDNMVYNWEDLNMSLFLPSLPSTSPWQEEGYSYLGLGMILLLLIVTLLTLIQFLRKKISITLKKRQFISIVVSLSVGAIVFLLLALSPKATFGTTELYHIKYPNFIFNILSIFRSTGRFIWPVYYGFMSGILILCIYLFRNRKKMLYVLLFLTLCIQTIDLLPGLTYKHNAYTQTFSSNISTFKSDAWEELGKKSSEIMFYPPTHYLLYCNPELSCRFEEYALQYDLSMNITYMSRDLSEQADKLTLEHFEQRMQGEQFSNDIIYVFGLTFDKPQPALVGLNYYLIDGYVIGTELDLSRYPDVASYIYE